MANRRRALLRSSSMRNRDRRLFVKCKSLGLHENAPYTEDYNRFSIFATIPTRCRKVILGRRKASKSDETNRTTPFVTFCYLVSICLSKDCFLTSVTITQQELG